MIQRVLRLKDFARNGSTVEYKVTVLARGAPGDTPESVTKDWALVEAGGWIDDGSVQPVPLRCSGSVYTSGWFGAVSRLGDGRLEFRTFQPADFDQSGGGLLRGATFKGMSGALLVDSRGQGFGIVGANRQPEFQPRTIDDERNWLDQNAIFGLARINPNDQWWKFVEPADEVAQALELLKSDDQARGLQKLKDLSNPDLVDIVQLLRTCGDMDFSGWN